MKRTYKKIYSLMLAVVVMTGAASCGDEFLDQRPSDGVSEGTAIKSSSDMATARTGMYAALKGFVRSPGLLWLTNVSLWRNARRGFAV